MCRMSGMAPSQNSRTVVTANVCVFALTFKCYSVTWPGKSHSGSVGWQLKPGTFYVCVCKVCVLLQMQFCAESLLLQSCGVNVCPPRWSIVVTFPLHQLWKPHYVFPLLNNLFASAFTLLMFFFNKLLLFRLMQLRLEPHYTNWFRSHYCFVQCGR